MSGGFIVVLCADCRDAPVVARPRYGYDRAEYWDGMLICAGCARARGPIVPKAVA